jgi:hypothetical protein
LSSAFLARCCEFAERHAPFRLQAHVDHGKIILDRGDRTLDDAAFEAFILAAEGFIQSAAKSSRVGIAVVAI